MKFSIVALLSVVSLVAATPIDSSAVSTISHSTVARAEQCG